MSSPILTRRALAICGLSALAAPYLVRANPALPPLNKMLPRRITFGATFGSREAAEPLAQALLIENVDIITPEFALKPAGIFPGGGQHCKKHGRITAHWLDFSAVKKFAGDNSKQVHAHTFLFAKHSWPTCIVQYGRIRPEFLEMFADRVAGLPHCDFFNEVLVKLSDPSEPYNDVRFESHQTEQEREAEVVRLLHPNIPGASGAEKLEFLANAVRDFKAQFKDEKELMPDLLLNEDELSNPGEKWAERKRRAVLALLEALDKRGARLTGVGIQSHLSATKDRQPNIPGTKAFVQALGALNYDVHISELDVKTSTLGENEPFTEKDHAALVVGYLSALLPEANVRRVAVWGLADPLHIQRVPYLDRKETVQNPLHHALSKPTLFDDDYQPKLVAHKLGDLFSLTSS